MMTSLDDFALQFDSITVDRPWTDNEPAPASTGPGFSLIDDAGGRFVIDRETGIVSISHASVLETDAGAVFPARIHCLEHSGASYELAFKLRITGHVPQIVGQDENFALAAIGAIAAGPPAPWSSFAVAKGHGARRPLDVALARFGALTGADLPAIDFLHGALGLAEAPPAPPSVHAHWTL